jgi:hypothetical protein
MEGGAREEVAEVLRESIVIFTANLTASETSAAV